MFERQVLHHYGGKITEIHVVMLFQREKGDTQPHKYVGTTERAVTDQLYEALRESTEDGIPFTKRSATMAQMIVWIDNHCCFWNTEYTVYEVV